MGLRKCAEKVAIVVYPPNVHTHTYIHCRYIHPPNVHIHTYIHPPNVHTYIQKMLISLSRAKEEQQLKTSVSLNPID